MSTLNSNQKLAIWGLLGVGGFLAYQQLTKKPHEIPEVIHPKEKSASELLEESKYTIKIGGLSQPAPRTESERAEGQRMIDAHNALSEDQKYYLLHGYHRGEIPSWQTPPIVIQPAPPQIATESTQQATIKIPVATPVTIPPAYTFADFSGVDWMGLPLGTFDNLSFHF